MKILIPTILVLILAAVLFSGCSGKRPDTLGVHDEQLAPCPDSPNCVSTQAEDDTHTISPIPMSGPTSDVMTRLISTIETMGGKVITVKDNYLHAEYTSRFWRFVDDVECYYDEKNEMLHVRSASRIGYSDFNVNRERVEKLTSLLNKGVQ